jgi:SAM-dependent methyltransferase
MVATREPAGVPKKTFRDPAGFLIRAPLRILRVVEPGFLEDLEPFLRSATARNAGDALVRTRKLEPFEAGEAGFPGEHVYEHERIEFPSYPYEWPAEMLHCAGALTLDLALSALEEGFVLKDATPHNVLYRGPRPVFVDLLSFQKRAPLDPSWRAYGQLARTFLLPLLAARTLGTPVHESLGAHGDGLEPEVLYRQAGFARRLSPRFLSLVSFPTWLGARARAETYRGRAASSAAQAAFVVRGLLESCRGQLAALAPQPRRDSRWSGYLENAALYSARQLAQKEDFARFALEHARPAKVLDVGANEGRFSLLAARQGASVVAIDSDPAVVGTMWRHASEAKLDVLPLVVDIARPTPATGWRNQEYEAFLDRARGQFDLVMMLALLHHLLVTHRIPLEAVLELAWELTREYVLIEFIAPEDPMFRRIVRGREPLYAYLTREHFEATAGERFEQIRSERIEGLDRWLYLLRRRGAR